MYNLYQMLPSFNEFRGAIDRERNGSTGKEMVQPGKKWLNRESKPRPEGAACPLCPPPPPPTPLPTPLVATLITRQ